MRIFVPKETHNGEHRVPLIPQGVKKLVGLGAEVVVESGMGQPSQFEDAAYTDSGATVATDRGGELGQANIVLRLRKPSIEEVKLLKEHLRYRFCCQMTVVSTRDNRTFHFAR